MSERSPTLSYRLDMDYYQKYEEFVEQSPLTKSQVSEKAVEEFLDRRTFFLGKLRISLGIAIIAVVSAFYASQGNFLMTAVAVVLFTALPYIAPLFSDLVQ